MDLFWFNNQQKPIPTRYHADEQRTRLGRWLVNRRFTRVSPWVVIGDPALLCFLFLFAANCNYLLQKQRSTWRHWYLRCPWRNMQKKFLVFTRMHRNTTTPRDTPYGNEMLSHAHEVICFCMSLRVLRNTPFTRYNRLYNQFDNRLYRVNKHPTGGKTGCQTGLTTVLNEQPLFVQSVVTPGCTTGLTTGCIHDTAVCQTGCTVYTNIYPVVKPVWQQVVSCKQGLCIRSFTWYVIM